MYATEDSDPTHDPPVGILTGIISQMVKTLKTISAIERAEWAKVRELLLENGNKEVLEKIQVEF